MNDQKDLSIKEKDELLNKLKLISSKNNNLLKDISNLNTKIMELNEQILNNNNILKSKDREIEKEINAKNNFNQLYKLEKEKYNKLENQLLFYQQIISDKENEINNLRKSNRLYDTKKFYDDNYIKDIGVGDIILLKKEFNNLKNNYDKVISDNEILKMKNKEYISLQLQYNELNDKFNMANEAKNELLKNRKENEDVKNENYNLIQENEKLKNLINILNTQNKNLLYEKSMNKNKDDSIAIKPNNIPNNENKLEKYLSTNIDELNSKLNNLLKDNIDYENKLNKNKEEKESLLKRISEFEIMINDMGTYIEELEKCNEQYRFIVQDSHINKNNKSNFNFNNITNSSLLNEKTLNNSIEFKKYSNLNLKRIKSNSSMTKKNIVNISNFMEDEENI